MSWGSLLPRLGLVAVAAALGLGTATAAADPVDTVETETPAPSAPVTPTPPASTPPASAPASTSPSEPSVSEPPASAPAAAAPELEVVVDFDKDGYRTGEAMSIRFEVVNRGAETVRDIKVIVHLNEPDAIQTEYESWGRLNTGVDIAGGGSHVATVTGRVGDPDATNAVLAGFLYDGTGASVVEFRHSVPVTPAFGRAGGVVYADENGNARFDAGEGLPGVEVIAQNQVQYTDTYTATTGADGSFTFPRLPTVRMALSANPPDGWLVGYQFVTIDESSSNDDLRVRAVRPLADLTVSFEFEKDSYRVAEQAKVRVRLTNRGDHDLVGLVANCNRGSSANSLTGRTPGWGALAGGGVTVRAKRTLDLTVTEAVPRAAFNYGKVFVGCDLSYPNVEDQRNPWATDDARVPGGIGTVQGVVGHFANGNDQPPVGVGDARLVLATEGRCPIVARTRSDDDGRFSFGKVPTGEYELYLLAPDGWQAAHENPSPVYVMANRTLDLVPQVVPGRGATPALPAQPAGCADDVPPRAQGRTTPRTSGLAHTGADVAGLFALGLGTVIAGVGVLGIARRRSPWKVTVRSR